MLNLSISTKFVKWFTKVNITAVLAILLSVLSVAAFIYFYSNGLSLAYNDARSHLNIARRVVEGLKPGFAQIGSVWLPLPHLLMVPTVWNDFMWHTGLAGALVSMISFVATCLLIYSFLKSLGASLIARILAIFIFASNINILYLQSTAMTELLLLATLMAGVYELVEWVKEDKTISLVKAAFWIMLSSLIRYEGWFLLICAGGFVSLRSITKGYKYAEGITILFGTLAGLGVIGWLVWNQLIFGDALYFAFGPFSARAQQTQIEAAGLLLTKRDLLFSIKVYLHALAYNSGMLNLVLAGLGTCILWLDKNISPRVRFASLLLFAPLAFNILALYMGHSVLFIQGLSGDTWFNVRYGVMLAPAVAILIGYLFHRAKHLRIVILSLIALTTFFAFKGFDAVTIDDARVGSSQKNVSEVSTYLSSHAANQEGFVLISAASHDAIIFSSGLPMSRFIHEGTGAYWEFATTNPSHWARWIIMRTNDESDLAFKTTNKSGELKNYNLVERYPFADVYELKPEFNSQLVTKPILGKQK